MEISLIISTHNRAKYLRRSLESWAKQVYNHKLFEVIIVNDRSEDNTDDIVNAFKDRLNIKYIKLSKGEGFRGHTVGYNRALREAEGDICLFSHPEIMFPPDMFTKLSLRFNELEALNKAYERDYRMIYMTVKPLWLPEADYDAIDWQENIYRLLSLLDFDQDMDDLPIDYRAQTQMLRNEWGSTTTFAMKRSDLKNIGGFFEFDCWGPDDINMMYRRRIFDMQNEVLQGTFVFHQNHDNDVKATKRIDINEVYAKVPKMKTIAEAKGPLKLEDFKY